MAIQVYDMGLDFTKGEGDKPESISDFRKKQSETKLANAQADKYRAEDEANQKAAALQAQSGEFLKQTMNLKGADGRSPATEEEKMVHLRGLYGGAGMTEQYDAVSKSIAEFSKAKQDKAKADGEIKEANSKRFSPVWANLREDPSDANIERSIKSLMFTDPEAGKRLQQMYSENKEMPLEERSQFFGSRVHADYDKMTNVDTGDGTQRMRPNEGGFVPKHQSDNSIATQETATLNREQKASQFIIAEENKNTRAANTIANSGQDNKQLNIELKTGQRWELDENGDRTGNIETIKGSKQDFKNKEQKAKDAESEHKRIAVLNTAADSNKFVLTALHQIKKNAIDWSTTGFAGAIAQWIPQTIAWDQSEAIKTVEAHVSFSGLSDMREASKTGGALGSIAVRELDLLGALRGSLSMPQKKETFKKNVNAMLKSYVRVQNNTLALAGRFNEINVGDKPITEDEYKKLAYGEWFLKSDGTKSYKPYPKTGAK